MTIKDDGTVKVEDYLKCGKGRAILTSSTARETSMAGKPNPDGSIGLSIYTYYLVEGLTTGAAADDDGMIYVKELHDYASKKVKIAAPAMNPELYRVSDGEKILVAKSPIDPKLKYERYFRSRIDSKGNLSNGIKRQTLIKKQKHLGISPEEAGRIEERVLQPYRDYQQKLEEYEYYLTAEVKKGYPLVPLLADLKEYQQELKLRDEDIAEIHGRLLPPDPPTQSNLPSVTIPITPSAPVPQPPVIEPTQNIISLSTFSFETAQVNLVSGKIEITKSPGSAQHFAEELGNGVKLEMVYVPGRQFMMGSNKHDVEYPPHRVNVPSFLMSKYPVTQAQYESIIGSNPSHFKGSQLPVESVSWNDAQAFCQKLTKLKDKAYSLPSEAQWEYSCRAGTDTPFYFGKHISPDVANYNGTYRRTTTDVGSFPANSFGLYDLHGNVWEWCLDTWHGHYEGAPTDGSAWIGNNNYRLLRGGSWSDYRDRCRSSSRIGHSRDYRSRHHGFRVVRSLTQGFY